MTPYKYLITLCLIGSGIALRAQDSTTPEKHDSTVIMKVFGTCDQCKHRIETVGKGRGVKSVDWNVNTKLLTLVFNPSQTSLNKIENRIVSAGHDLEHKKAKDAAYNDLPACCRYREMESMMSESHVTSQASDTLIELVKKDSAAFLPDDGQQQSSIRGIVLEANDKGEFKPLAGASIVWLGASQGTVTNSNGVFSLEHEGKASRLVISHAGYQGDTVSVTNMTDIKVVLASGTQLKEVRITARQRSSYVSSLSPIRTQVMTERELFKAACCNLSESFETNPSVDVSYNDAITGSKQIQLLGLSGNYTQLTVENLPGPRGIATPLGLNSIAGPWVESIQLTKGIGSVANGYESIAGQINVELRKPENSERLYANAYVNDFGKTDINLNLSTKVGNAWSTTLLLHDDFLKNHKLDFNDDGFRDLPTGNQFSAVNRWKYDNAKGWMAQFGLKVLNDERTGGQIAFDPSKDKLTSNHYGLGISTQRYEGFGKIGYVFPAKKYKSIGLQLSAITHRQDSYFGLTEYNAQQENFYSNLIYQSIINNTNHKFRTGLSFLYDKYDEDYNNANHRRTEIVPGAFFEYTYSYLDKFNVVAGVRADHNSLFGLSVTPRLHLRYEPVSGTTIRVSLGRGQRTANIFAENMSVFASSRQVNISLAGIGKAYGLDPEIAWNKGISIDQKFKLFQRDGMFSVDYFRNDFEDQVVVDLENPREVRFYNLKGRSYSNSFQAELNFEPVKKLEAKLAYRFFDVKTSYDGELLQRPLTASHRAFGNLAFSTNGWKFDYTANYTGKKRIPNTDANPVQYRRGQYSPSFVLMNAQVSKSFGKKHMMDFYVGGENLTNYFQKDVIIAADQPFSQYFDASLVWAPVTGRMFYVGWRYKIK